MSRMDYTEFQQYRDIWGADTPRLMTKAEVEKFDDFFANPEEAHQYHSSGLTRALAGDYSQYETVEPMIKGYLGAKKCYELFDRYQGNASDPALHQEIKSRLMEADLRAGFAMGSKDPNDSFSIFLKECERSANRQTLIQTLEEPDSNAKLRLFNEFQRNDPNTAEENLNAALNRDLEQRVEIAKVLFMNHLGNFQVLNSNQPMEMKENMAEVYAHGGRTMFILPAGGNQDQVMDGIRGAHPDQSNIQSRWFATHAVTPRSLNKDGSVKEEATELKVRNLSTFSPRLHKGMNASVGGLGQIGPNGKLITPDGTNGHMYMHMVKGDKNTCGTMLVGFENAGPGKKGRLGHAHDASAKKAGSSAFLSDKSYLGNESGGRVVDLSGLSSEALCNMLTQFETRYREAAMAARAGDSALLNACNDMLTGKPMSVGQLKGMLQGLQVPEDQLSAVDQARAGYPHADNYKAVLPEESEPVPMKLGENPERKPCRVTECDGLVRPKPPAVMKKPSRWQKFLHEISFHSKNSYVSQYKEYERTLPERMEEYKAELDRYNRNLTALEQGGDPEGLRAAYQRAVEQAQSMFGPVENNAAVPNVQEQQAQPDVQSTSKEMVQRLEDALLDTLFDGVNPGNATVEEQENIREEFRGHIQETEGYRKLLQSGDQTICAILNDTDKMHLVCSDVFSGIMDKLEPGANVHSNNEPQRNNEKVLEQSNAGNLVMGG